MTSRFRFAGTVALALVLAAPATMAQDNDPAPGFSLGDAAEPAAAAPAEDEPMELSEVAATYDDTADELVLDAPAAPVPNHAAAPVEPSARPVGGGTLFERMSRLSRGASAPDEGDGAKDDAVDIPRFLGRQNNQ